jgi:hypothetical protein
LSNAFGGAASLAEVDPRAGTRSDHRDIITVAFDAIAGTHLRG